MQLNFGKTERIDVELLDFFNFKRFPLKGGMLLKGIRMKSLR